MARVAVWIFTIILAAVGLTLAAGGVVLIGEGGSLYYLVAGLATLATAAPFVDGLGIATFDASSLDPLLQGEVHAVVLDVEPGYFGTVGTPLVAGRLMDEGDREVSEPVAVVSRGMARLLGGERAAVGRCVPGRGGCARDSAPG